MKKRISMWGVFACVLVATAMPAMADLTATVTLTDSYGNGSGAGHGGEFLALPTNLSIDPVSLGQSSGRFETFCVERDETFNFGGTYYAAVNTEAVTGGAGGPSPDPISPETAYLYSKFVSGSLPGYDYGTGSSRVRSANALQNVIWYLEEELGTHDYLWNLNGTEQVLATMFYTAAINSGWTDIGSVRVLNLFANANGTGHKQDQLVMDDPTKKVPEPGAVILGLVGLGLITRRRTR